MSRSGSKIFIPNRSLGYVSNHIPLQVRYIKRRNENLIVTCTGKSFITYGISHFTLLSVSRLHTSDITCLTADAFHVYTACDNLIYAWRRGTELKHIYKGHKANVFILMPFGPHLLTLDEDNILKIWDIKSEEEYLELSFDKDNFKISTMLHPATYINKILLGSEQGNLQLWNINKAKLIYSFKGWGSGISCLEQAPAIDVIAIGLLNGKIILHNLKYDETVVEFTQDWGLITAISFRTDGHPIMATGSLSGHIVFWNLEEKRVASQLTSAHDSAVTGMKCIPGEPLLVTSSPDNTLKLWIFDMPDGGARLLRLREGHHGSPLCVRFHGANGHNLLSAGSDSTLRIFNLLTETFNKSLGKASYNRKVSKKKNRIIAEKLKMPPIINFTSETTREKEWDNIAAIHLGLTVVTTWSYDKVKMGELKLIPERYRSIKQNISATCISLTHCGNFVIIGYSTGSADRFNIQSGIHRATYESINTYRDPVRGVAVDLLNKIVLIGSKNKVYFWKFKDPGTIPFMYITLESPISFFRPGPSDSSLLCIALEDCNCAIIDIESRSIIRAYTIGKHSSQLTDVTFSPDGRWLITAGMDCTIKTWDVVCATLIDQFKIDAVCVSLSFSPTGEYLATAHVDYLGVYLWSNRTLYNHVLLKPLDEDSEATLVCLPGLVIDDNVDSTQDIEDGEEDSKFKSPDQISHELLTLSDLPASRWQNLLNIDIIKRRNKPKSPPKVPKAAPFFLPTISSLNFQFDLGDIEKEENSKLLVPQNLTNLSAFGKLLDSTVVTKDYVSAIEKLKSFSPSMIDFEIKNLAPDEGGSLKIMLQMLKMIESMFLSNKDFEIAQAYLGVFLKHHGTVISETEELSEYLINVKSCQLASWTRLQDILMSSLCIVDSLKSFL